MSTYVVYYKKKNSAMVHRKLVRDFSKYCAIQHLIEVDGLTKTLRISKKG